MTSIRKNVVEKFCGIHIINDSVMPSGMVAIIKLDGKNTLACATGTRKILKEEIRRYVNGEPSKFDILFEEALAPVI